jgi:hypothetical protein
MTKLEALEALAQGQEITHLLFDSEEKLKINNMGEIEDNNGNTIKHASFLQERSGLFEEGWKIYG